MGVCHFTPGTPVEIVETEYPLMIRKFDVWQDSAGAGKQRGGIGFGREYELSADCILTARTANHRKGGWGLNGGKGPPVCRTTINPDTSDSVELECLDTRECAAGTIVRLEQCGGSGYGDPMARSVEAVLTDVQNGYVSPSAALQEYGVVVEDGAVVADETGKVRASGRGVASGENT
jgi:N-methylhydantoinase B